MRLARRLPQALEQRLPAWATVDSRSAVAHRLQARKAPLRVGGEEGDRDRHEFIDAQAAPIQAGKIHQRVQLTGQPQTVHTDNLPLLHTPVAHQAGSPNSGLTAGSNDVDGRHPVRGAGQPPSPQSGRRQMREGDIRRQDQSQEGAVRL